MGDIDIRDIQARNGVSYLLSPIFGTLSLEFLVKGDSHPCPYIPGQEAREQLFMTDALPPELYHDFMDIGFRRYGSICYRPDCDACNECRPIRTVLAEYEHRKPHRRILGKNQDVTVSVGLPKITSEKIKLYKYYLSSRHSSEQTSDLKSLYSSSVQTIEFEYKLHGRIIAAGLTDVCSRSLSSVYVYYDPDLSSRSLGTLAALQEIMFACSRNIPYYYLGFWIADCKAMNYKVHYKPYQILDENFEWTDQNVCGEVK